MYGTAYKNVRAITPESSLAGPFTWVITEPSGSDTREIQEV
jgi:hypothetical protein